MAFNPGTASVGVLGGDAKDIATMLHPDLEWASRAFIRDSYDRRNPLNTVQLWMEALVRNRGDLSAEQQVTLREAPVFTSALIAYLAHCMVTLNVRSADARAIKPVLECVEVDYEMLPHLNAEGYNALVQYFNLDLPLQVQVIELAPQPQVAQAASQSFFQRHFGRSATPAMPGQQKNLIEKLIGRREVAV